MIAQPKTTDDLGVGQLRLVESEESAPVDRDKLRADILDHLKEIGLNGASSEDVSGKDSIRKIHVVHRRDARARIVKALKGKIDRLMTEYADGCDVDPNAIEPELVVARSGSPDGNLFRLSTLLWSIPVSSGYGRRMRYLVRDRQNGKLIGIFAIGDPVFNLRARDDWIGWKQNDRRERLAFVMDAYAVGSVPPYNRLLGGKLIASLIGSSDVCQDFADKYGDSAGIIGKRKKNARLALVTVTSALGRSSIYNRVRLFNDYKKAKRGRVGVGKPLAEILRIGKTKGYGHFQFPTPLYEQVRQLLIEDGHDYANGHQFGDGPNWRVRVLREGLKSVGLPPELLKHGIEREVYAMPVASNFRAFLKGEETEPEIERRSVADISEAAKRRWMIPRAERMPDYRNFRVSDMAHMMGLDG